MPDSAHARSTDPHTSHEAAAAVTAHLTSGRAIVEAYARRKGADGFTDIEMHDELGDSGSSLRSRRNELTAMNRILDSGRTARYGNQMERVVWVHRDFVTNPPPALDKPPSRAEADKTLESDAEALRVRLRSAGEAMHREGRTGAEALFNEAEQLIGRLLRR